MRESISNFSVDFREDRIYIENISYPTGHFATTLLNQFYDGDAGQRVIVFRLAGERVAEALKVGYIMLGDFAEAGKEIIYILDALGRLSPYKFLDIESERDRIKNLFSDESAELIQDYFDNRAKLIIQGPSEIAISHLYNLKTNPLNHPGGQMIDAAREAVQFYHALGEDISLIHKNLCNFIKALNTVERFDDYHLINLAEDVFGKTLFNVRTEYVSISKTKSSNKPVLARRLYFDRLLSFFISDFFEGLLCGHYPRRCLVCKKYFLMENARRQKYCTGNAPPELTDGRKISCRKYALRPESGFTKEKAPEHPVKILYKNRCSSIRQYLYRDKITPEFAELAKRLARQHRDEALRHEEYARTEYIEDMKHTNLFDEVRRRMKE